MDGTSWLNDYQTLQQRSIAAGVAEKKGDSYYITHVVRSPDGYLGKYRKVVMAVELMGRYFSCGEDFLVFEIGGAKIGINICNDNGFENNANILARQGADVLLAPFTCDGENPKKWSESIDKVVQKQFKECAICYCMQSYWRKYNSSWERKQRSRRLLRLGPKWKDSFNE